MKTFKALGAAALLSTSLLGAVTSFASEEYTPDPAKTTTPVKATFTLPEDGGTTNPPVDPEGPQNPDGNKPNPVNGPFGIAYQPALLEVTSTQLQESGQQEFNFTAENPHVGVKDKTRQTFGWTLNASLTWDQPESTIKGTYIQTSNTAGEVKMNNSTAEEEKLDALSNNEVTGASDVKIDTTPTLVMQGQEGKQRNGVYDYALTDAKLVVPEAGNVEAGEYTGHITWDLAKTEA